MKTYIVNIPAQVGLSILVMADNEEKALERAQFGSVYNREIVGEIIYNPQDATIKELG